MKKGVAMMPDVRKQWLIWIKDCDFNWQEQYRYSRPVRLPAETRLEMKSTSDTEANPRNPNHPAKRVQWGPGSADEMAGLHVQVILVHTSDMEELSRALWDKFMRGAYGGGFYRCQ